jgi:preprotein translocase subunit SecE
LGGVLDVSKEMLMAPKNKKKLSIIERLQRFWRETVGELRKVTWPTPQEAWKMTRIVLVVMAVMALVLGLLDIGFSRLITFLVAL